MECADDMSFVGPGQREGQDLLINLNQTFLRSEVNTISSKRVMLSPFYLLQSNHDLAF